MNTLAALQTRLALAIRQRNDALSDLVTETRHLDRNTRLGIYADAYLLRLDEALRSNYPKLHLLLGDEAFLSLTSSYLQPYPSQRPSIRYFGDALADFLATAPQYTPLPILAELARFEWALGSAFDAADAPVADITALNLLQDEDWPVLQPCFQTAFRLLVQDWNTVAVWQALDADQEPPAPESGTRHWAVWRHALQPRYRSLADDEAALLAACLAGQPFALACEHLLPWHAVEEAPMRAAGLLGIWLNEGWISGLRTAVA
ncbi:HvfC/BufC family peptide modification chaperone [Chitinimonas naiadis]